MSNTKDETCPDCGDSFEDYFNRPPGGDRCPMCVDESGEYKVVEFSVDQETPCSQK